MTSVPQSLDSTIGSTLQAPTADVRVGASRYPPVEALLGDAATTGRTRSALVRTLAGGRRDPVTLLAVSLAAAVVTVTIIRPPAESVVVLVASLGYVGLDQVLARVPVRRRSGWLMAVRFMLALGFVVVAGVLVDPSGTWPFNSLMIPVVALAAAQSQRAAWVAVGALVIAILPGFIMGEHSVDLARRLIAWSFAAAITAIGTRQVISSLERSRDRLRQAQLLQRRRSRQLAAVEAVGGILAREGPSPAAFDSVVGLLVETFGYRYPSIYTWDGAALHLGAQRNYTTPIELFPPEMGIIGRVARTLEPVFIPDVTKDPDYVSADNDVVGEIGVPLLADGELFGVLNVEMPGTRRLDRDDFATLKIVADRIAAALAFGRERQKLTERAGLMDRLAGFTRSLGRSLDPVTVNQQVAVGAGLVISADMTILVLREPGSGEFRTVQVEGGDPSICGVRIEPGEGVTGQAIQQAALVVQDRLERQAFPKGAARIRMADTLAAMSTPLMTDTGVAGALSWFREDLDRAFTPQEREVAGLLGAQVALAITNAELHHATEVAAATDALTGLPNRRHFDASVARIEAARRREHEDERRPLSVIVFDLDHFGLMNKRHGHQVGDRVLQAFAEVIRHRVRASDLTARYGGEEFVVVLDGATRTEAVRLAEEIRETFESVGFGLPDGTAVTCTVSAGCASLAATETSGAVLIERADVGLAMAKASGRNRVVAA